MKETFWQKIKGLLTLNRKWLVMWLFTIRQAINIPVRSCFNLAMQLYCKDFKSEILHIQAPIESIFSQSWNSTTSLSFPLFQGLPFTDKKKFDFQTKLQLILHILN